MYKTVVLRDLKASEVHDYLNHAIVPRPICFASTIDAKGNVNLSPFSYFNLFGLNPPIVIFSPLQRMRDNTSKHTLQNILEVPEVVINIVSYDMIQQMSLSSCEFPKGTDEFIKSGVTKEPSVLIQPPRVRESPVQMECKVVEIKSAGDKGGSANLVIAEVLLMHINENMLDENGKIDQLKMDVVARLGGNWYARINANNLFEVEKPNREFGIGLDNLPGSIKNSKILTGNHLGQLGGVSALPDVDPNFEDEKLKNIFQYYSINPDEMESELHLYAADLLNNGQVNEAWQVLLALA
jgi:flavin reductase (DIM6/NTAB) family NADH-FMN oxidoreductase RutF